MKLIFLDVRNCHALFPKVRGFSLARTLDEYLQIHVNNKRSELHGSVDELIKHNEKTKKHSISSQRLCKSPIEIAMICDATNQEIDVQGIKSPLRGPAYFHTILKYANGITWKTVIPLQFLLKGWGDANRGHQCYIHTISNHITDIQSFADMQMRSNNTLDDFHYAGITGRDWLLRFREHMREIKQGSTRRFYMAWRECMGKADVHYISQLMEINLTFEDAMNWEEQRVDILGPNGLNMIPGGFKGLQYLHEHRIINRTDITLEERDRAIVEYIRQNPRKGIPNPFIAELWKDDEYYLKVIEAKPNTLSAEQVKQIRKMAELGRSISEITEAVDALNELQVKNVISGKYYNRIH